MSCHNCASWDRSLVVHAGMIEKNTLSALKIETPQLILVTYCEVATGYHKQIAVSFVWHSGLQLVGSATIDQNPLIDHDTFQKLNCDKRFKNSNLADTVSALDAGTMAPTK